MTGLNVILLTIGGLASLSAFIGASNKFIISLKSRWIEDATNDNTLKTLVIQVADIIKRLERIERKQHE